MDESTSNRLSGLSKKQLLAAIEALTGECGSTAINALTGYLDTIQFPRGSSNVVKKSLYATEVNTEPTIAKMENSFTLEK